MEDHQYYSNHSNAYNEEIIEESNKKDDISIEEKDGDALLIELYRERPFLYNKGHNDFKNKIIKDNAWNGISKIMQDKNYGNFYTPDYCQTRCISLRNQYNREKRTLDSQYKSGNGASTHKPFVFYSQLSFLDDYIRRRRTYSNINANKALISSVSSCELSPKFPKSSSNEIFDIDTKSTDSIYKKEDNFNNEENKENILVGSALQATYKRISEKDLDTSHIKPVKYKKSKVDETKELDCMFSSISQKIINVLDDKRENNEDEAFTHFIIAHLANLPQSEKNIRRKMITDALFSPLQKT